MPEQKCHDNNLKEVYLSFFACPNSECADFNHFGAGNLSIAEWMGKDKAIRRLYCKTCGLPKPRAFFKASTQNSDSSVTDNSQERTYRLNQSITAAR